jgi:uncharacterized protein (DUF1330 family)
MPAYVIVNVIIDDLKEYEEYKKLTPASIAAYDGKFVVRGGATEILEGSPTLGRIVVLEFPTAERAKEWWSSPEYGAAKVIRQRASTTEMILVEGVG